MDEPYGGIELSPVPYEVGRIVVSEQGKDRGTLYVVVGYDGWRLALADAMRSNVSRPKRKNPKHVCATPLRAATLVGAIERGEDIDRGRFCQVLAEMRALARDEAGA
ncbi:MAG: KOW domain-containing RNA-binding protein [Synergistaceae bacterium]|nr:KOW domain-containing RNA-binding protein [Synergistaceae bacterium]